MFLCQGHYHIGKEGIVGERAIFEGGLLQMRCSLLTEGHAYRMSPAFFNEEFQTGGKLHDLVMRSLEARMLETSQTALCCQMHPLEQRLSRWLLTFADRLGSEKLRLTHQTIAQMLGTRRQGITGAVRVLSDAELIGHSRGFITIINRQGLEMQTCECYQVMKKGVERAYQLKRTMMQSGDG